MNPPLKGSFVEQNHEVGAKIMRWSNMLQNYDQPIKSQYSHLNNADPMGKQDTQQIYTGRTRISFGRDESQGSGHQSG